MLKVSFDQKIGIFGNYTLSGTKTKKLKKLI